MPRYAGVLFDVDETLYDRRGAQHRILRDLVAQLPELFGGLTQNEVEAAWAESDRQTADHAMTTTSIEASRDARSALLLKLLGRPEARARAVSAAYVEAYRRTAAPIAGAAETVRRCARHLPVGIVSNAFPDVQYHKIDSLGVRELFRCILLSEEVGVRKPAPAIFAEGCRLLGTAPGETLYVGDSYGNDVVGARDAGLVSCWFNPGGAPLEPGNARPDVEIRGLNELGEVLGLPV